VILKCCTKYHFSITS